MLCRQEWNKYLLNEFEKLNIEATIDPNGAELTL